MTRAAAHATVFQAIADPTRRAILDALREGERSVSAILSGFRISQPALSQHLGVLRRAGLVTHRRDGRRRLYSLRAEPLREVEDWVAVYEPFWDSRLENLGRYLERRRSGSEDTDPGATP
jgi:DNA-binding transcriptional ArsR family regulator